MKSWNGKVAIVTGAACGIGAATAELFASHGAAIVLVDVNADVGGANARTLENKGAKALFVRADVAAEKEVAAVAEKALAAYGRVDLLVNNAGIMRRHVRLEDWTLEEFRRVVDVNLNGLFVMTRLIAPRMMDGGAIVNVASTGALSSVAYSPCYAAAKAGVLGLTRSLAVMLASRKVRVNAILPSLVDTPMTVDAPARQTHPGAFLAPQDIARAIFYASENDTLNSAFIVVNNTEHGPRLYRVTDPPEQTLIPDSF